MSRVQWLSGSAGGRASNSSSRAGTWPDKTESTLRLRSSSVAGNDLTVLRQNFGSLQDRGTIPFQYTFNNGVPTQITEFVSPYTTLSVLRLSLGLFAQDQWRINRMTLNLGLRYEYVNAYSPEPLGRRCSLTSPRRDLFKQLIAMGALPGLMASLGGTEAFGSSFDPQIERFVTRHVDAGIFEQIDRIFRSAGAQECEGR